MCTSFVTLKHSSSSSWRPALTYSPLLNEQHSRRRRRLRAEKWGISMRRFAKKGNRTGWEDPQVSSSPVEELRVDEGEDLAEGLPRDHGRDLRRNGKSDSI